MFYLKNVYLHWWKINHVLIWKIRVFDIVKNDSVFQKSFFNQSDWITKVLQIRERDLDYGSK